MRAQHTVKPGEHLARIAAAYGFENLETIWNDPANEPIRAQRESPEQLLPGDVIAIPDKKPAEFNRPTGTEHTFTVHLPRVEVRLKLLKIDGKPLADQSGTLEAAGKEQEVTTDGDGVLQATVPRCATTALLKLGELELPLLLGSLDPVSEQSGQVMRLRNLGYLSGETNDPVLYEQAVAQFQSEHDLEPTGHVDEKTADALVEAHGA